MLYEEYVKITQQVNQSVENKDYETALRLLEDLVQSDLPDIDKSFMCINLAVVWDKAGNSIETLRAYDRAIRLETPHHRCFAHEEKASYLVQMKRREEAAAIYQDLLNKSFLTLNDQERIRANLKAVENS